MQDLSRRALLAMAAGSVPLASQVPSHSRRAVVSLVSGEDRRKNVYNALAAIDDQIRPALKRKKYVLIKPNTVAVNNQLGSTHADALRGILDYLEVRFRGPIIIADSSKDNTWDAYENFRYDRVLAEYRHAHVRFVDFNEEEKYVVQEIVDRHHHLMQVRLAARLFDPDAFILGAALLKAHDNVVATLSVKNLVMAAPLHSTRNETTAWHDKSKYHQGYREIQMNLAITARRMSPFWGATVIDGYEGMEGEGPLRGTPVASRIAIASTDFVAADRIGVEAMGVNPSWVGYLGYCCDAGLGQYNASLIDLRGGVPVSAVRKEYKLHPRISRQLEWMGPLPKASSSACQRGYNSCVTRSVNRREFLAGGAALAGAASLAAAAPQMIDTHIHLYDPTRPQGVPWPAKTDALLYKPTMPETYAAMVRPLGITGAVVVEASAWVDDNQWVLDLAKEHRVIVGLVGHLEPGADAFAANLARFAKNPLFRGIRVNGNAIGSGMARPAFTEDLARLADAGLMLDAIGSAAMIPALSTLTGKIPKLRIAIDHMPVEPVGWQNSRAALLDLAKSTQVYCKVSGVLKRVDGRTVEDPGAYTAALDELWDTFGPDRVMYGSNWPVSDKLAPYETVLKVVQRYVDARRSGDADKFFRTNSKACYRWLDRG